jgi:hypothetical protein
VTLPEEINDQKNDPTAFADDSKSKMPPSTKLKAQIRQMEREDEAGNLYSTFKPSRLTRQERDEDLESRFLHPDLAANSRVSIQKFRRDNFKRGLQRHMGEQPFPV